MADKKISQLTAATTPLAGTEVLPIVQSGATVKVSIADVTAGRAVSATSIAAGLGAVGTPSYTFTGDTNTGIWSPSADAVAFSTAGAERMRIASDGEVGINTSSPSAAISLTVLANAGNAIAQNIRGRSDGIGVLLFSDNSNVENGRFDFRTDYAEIKQTRNAPLVFSTNATERVRITGAGNVGIGTAAPSFQLQLSTDSAAKPTTALWTIVSDSRIKTETGEYTKGLDAVCALRPITYHYNGTAGFVDDGKESISIIAQEAMQHFPECVGTFEVLLNEDDEEKTELFNWNGHALIFALVNAVKELKAMNEALVARMEQIKGV
jgi:hypothetical protein